MKELFLVVTILSLFLIGLLISLGSGSYEVPSTGRFRNLVGNLSSLLLRIVGYGVGLAAIQRMIGSPSLPDW